MYLLCHNGFASIFINIYNISRRASVAKLIQQYQCDMYDIFMKRVILIHVNNNMSLSCVRTVCSSLESENILIRVSVVSKFVIHSSYCGSSNIYNKRHGIWLRCEAWHILPSLNISIYLCHTHTFALHTAQCTHTHLHAYIHLQIIIIVQFTPTNLCVVFVLRVSITKMVDNPSHTDATVFPCVILRNWFWRKVMIPTPSTLRRYSSERLEILM